GHRKRYFMPDITGAGCALFDLENNGRLGIYLLHSGGPKGKRNQLFRQKRDGTFENISSGSGLDVAGYNQGVAIGDIDNDGLPDVLLTFYGGVKLFRNLGNGKFADITTAAGLNNPLWGTSAAFVDYDRDGRLDLVIVNYLVYDPSWECKGSGG